MACAMGFSLSPLRGYGDEFNPFFGKAELRRGVVQREPTAPVPPDPHRQSDAAGTYDTGDGQGLRRVQEDGRY